ncbi:MAG: molecular chaperone [Ewingella americana]|jgi:P pilus assembly chaperone PapD|uniref:FimC family chaperone n=2 Tax=Ewingella americana TaxID=41202 RepID=A0A085GHH5_EWIA3|nr:molecular chaperone [Ewingella americana]KAA8729363.1 molecular chaperone [Ewingella americana]KFC83170.1 FimC family chaperone [Ewingella americana ATCC 33852]MCI1680348.1 molecular chaperone [Ewingella americana]MCI1854499.1 molecular chaperone [Ewingella americana]MCI1860726.1 molecular chaperone [Ewingella americana]
MKRISALCCGALALLLVAPAFAGFSVGATRVVYSSDMKEASLSVKNTENSSVYLIRSWVSSDKAGEKVPFLTTPPLFRIDPGQDNALRITQTSSALPQDRESVYWLNTLAIPPSTKDKNTLQFAINTRIKLIYRPAALNDKKAVEAAYQQAKFARSGNKISVSNPTPYYLNLTKVTINNNELNEGFMVPPNSSLEIPNVPVGNSVTWQAINDYGGLSQKYTANF